MNKQPIPAQTNRMPLSELSRLIGDKVDIDDTPSLFSVTPTNRLDEIFAAMREAGYELEQPRRSLKSSKTYHAEWHVGITSPHAKTRFTMAFYVPEDYS